MDLDTHGKEPTYRCRLRGAIQHATPRRSRPCAACSASTSRFRVDLCFQGFDRELAELPGDYVSPGGCLLVAQQGRDRRVRRAAQARSRDVRDEAALRAAHAAGAGAGRALADAVIDEARRIGYRRMRLDTLPSMTEAAALYERLGFQEIEPYTANPVPGARFLQLAL